MTQNKTKQKSRVTISSMIVLVFIIYILIFFLVNFLSLFFFWSAHFVYWLSVSLGFSRVSLCIALPIRIFVCRFVPLRFLALRISVHDQNRRSSLLHRENAGLLRNIIFLSLILRLVTRSWKPYNDFVFISSNFCNRRWIILICFIGHA